MRVRGAYTGGAAVDWFAVDELKKFARDYAWILASHFPEEWCRLGELAWVLFEDPAERPILVEAEAAIHFLTAAPGSRLTIWLRHRVKRCPELELTLIDAWRAEIWLQRHFLDLACAGRVFVIGTRADTLTEYWSHPLLFDIDGIEIDLGHGEIRVPRAAGAPLVILGPRICLAPEPAKEREDRIRAAYEARIAQGGHVPTRSEDTEWARDNDYPIKLVLDIRAHHPDPRLHRRGAGNR
jgi:hypothetical protein